jgi:RimJ/RimL family protein N-acetyltransferase
MRLIRYGIQLEALRSDHLEMVRLWRNQDYVRNNMQFNELLSRSDQRQWFAKLDPEKNLYWVIRTNDYPIGLIHVKNIDLDNCTGEAGIFIGEPSYLEMPQPMLAILFMMELSYFVVGLKELKAKIKSGNSHAIRFNEKLGYRLLDGQPEGFQYYAVDKIQFEEATRPLRNKAAQMFGDGVGVGTALPAAGLHRKILENIWQFSEDNFKVYSL